MSIAAVRPASRADLEAITGIYNHYLATTHIAFDTEPWSVADRDPWFRQFAESGPHRLLVAARDEAVVGFTASTPIRPKPAYATSVETTVYIRPGAEGQGVGSLLYADLFDRLAAEDVYRAYAIIALPNPASIRLHERFGFQRASLFTAMGRKLGRFWDVAWYEKALRLVEY